MPRTSDLDLELTGIFPTNDYQNGRAVLDNATGFHELLAIPGNGLDRKTIGIGCFDLRDHLVAVGTGPDAVVTDSVLGTPITPRLDEEPQPSGDLVDDVLKR